MWQLEKSWSDDRVSTLERIYKQEDQRCKLMVFLGAIDLEKYVLISIQKFKDEKWISSPCPYELRKELAEMLLKIKPAKESF